MSKNNFQERLRKMEDTKQRFSIRKFSIGAASVLIGLTIFGMGNETVHAAEQPAQNQNGGVQTSAVNKEESDASKAKQEAETSVNVNSEVTENMQEVSVDQKANTAQLEKKAPASAVKEEKTVADPTPAKEQNATSKQDSASAQTSQPAVDSVKQNAKKTQQVGNDKAALATTINSEKTQQAGNGKAALATTITLNEPRSSVVEITESKATVQDKNSTTVKTAQELIDAIQKGTANTINIGANIDLGTISSYTNTNISNKRNIIIQSADGKQYTVDFSGYDFNMYSSDYGVTFKNLNLYGRSYYGIVRSAGSYTFDNVSYTGSELIYTDPGYNTTVNFYNKVTAHSVGSYKESSQWSQWVQGGNTQQVIQFAGGKNTINFNSGSDVTLTTTNSNVIEVDEGKTTINVKNGAKVSLNPHTHFFPEQHRMSMDGIARGIASNGDDTTLNIDGNLDINLTKKINGLFSSDKYLSGALYLNSGATINVNGNLNINSDGQPYYPLISRNYQGLDDPVYINGNATINVNDGGSFKVNATKIGNNYKGSIVTSNGNTTIAINHHGTFDVTGDGAKATGVSLGNGSTFTSTQPELFNISMPDGATAIAIKNGKVQFNGVKTSADSQPIGEIDITYNDGIPKVTVTSYDEATTTATRTAVNKAKNKINLVAAGKEVDLKDIMFTKDADGNYIMSGNANTADNNGAYVYISVNGTVHQVAPTDSQTLYTVGPTGGPTSSQVPYTAETGADGEFSVNLGKLKDTDQVSLYAAKDFVTSDKDTKTVSEWMTSFYRDQLQKLVDEAPTVEGGSNYINATDSLKTAYANAISDGSAFLQNPSATSEQLEAAATAITTAKTALNGDLNKVKQALEAAVKDAPNVRNTPAYYNAASAKQQAYNTAISDGSEALKAQNPTVESLTDALNKINEAKSALDGQPTDKQALQAAVNKSKDVKDSNNYANADQNAKTAYDNAVTAAQGVLDNSNATQAQVTQALQDLNTANGKLNGDAKTEEVKQALEAAVKDAPNVRNTPAYYNAASAKQQAYNTAISDGSEALKAQNPTVESLTDALNKINEAKSALDGQPTDKQALQAAVNKSKDVKDSNNYANADQNAKTAYDNAVTAAQGVLDNSNATQAQVTQALQDLNTANGKLNGDAKTEEVKQALEAAVKDAPNVRNTPAYYNAASAKQQAYNTAISDGSEALKAQNPTVESLTDALNKINEAKSALDGQPTDKQALQAAVNKSKDVKDSNNYANADQNAKTAYDNAVTAAQGVLDNSNATQAQVTQALQDLNTANDNLNGDAKTEAANRQALEDAVKEAPTVEKTDSKYYNGTEKAQDDYKNAVSEGQKVLDNANATADQIKTALDNINAAKGALDGDPTNKTILQNSVDNAVDLDKSNADAQAKKDYTDALNKAKQVLAYPNATQQAVNEANAALTNAKTALDNSSVLQNAKDALQRAVDAKSTTEKTPAYYNAASAKQQAYNTAISDGSDALKAQNPTVESLTTALNKINEAKSALDGKATDTSKLKAAVDNANTVKASNDYKDASADDQKQYDDAVKAGQQLLDPTTAPSPLTQADVDRAAKAITDAQSALTTSATTNVKDAKGKATADLTNAVDAAKKAIDQDTNLTEDERNAAKAQVDSDASAAKEAINKATTNDAVTYAATAGKVTIDKTVANAAIDNAAAGRNKAIDGSSLTDEEKNGIKDQVAQAVKTAKDIISAADTEQAVTTAQKNGVAAIAGIKVPTESATKTAADKAIDEALANKQAEINKSTTLTDEEKANLNQQAQNAANTAKQNIANAKTDSAVATAQENGVAAIDGIKVPTESATKTAADKAIDEALANKQAEINKSTTLTDEEKANLNQQAQNAANTAKQNIANAKTDSAVATAQENGVAAIDGIKVSANSTAKDQAKSNITDAADKAKQTIDQDNNLTNDQKQAAKAQVDADAKTAQEAINKATTNDDVTSATNTGKLAIDKAVANAAIDNAVAGKKAEISNAKDLSSDDVKALNNEVDQAANDAKNAISSATTEKAVKTAQTDGVDKINAIDVATTAAKDKAKSDIDQTANDAKKAIDDNKDLTDDQKTAAKDQIDQDAAKAKDNINNAKTDKDVEDANNAGQLAIAKDGAKAAIQGALNKKLNEIDSASALTSDEKAKLTNDANTAATNANKAIDAATTPIEVTSAQTAGIQDIENVKVPAESTTKDQAKSNITDAADKAKQTIDQDNNLTNDQKQAAKDQVDTDAKNAQDAIDNAKTDADVNNAADNGKIAIDKTVADAAIDNAVAGKIKDVKAPLTTDEQKTLTDLIKETGENAKQNIANATTPAEVTIAQDAGVNAIDQINVPTTSPVKDAADKAIDEALKNKTAAINKADNITDQEKHSLIDKVNKAADDATSAIKNATTDNAVKDAETKGLNEINGVTIPTLAEKQQAANVAIDQAAKAKKAEIAKALQAGNIDQAKADSLNTEVDNDVTNAMKAIANATTNAAVVVAQNDGIHKIKAIKVPSSTYNPDITNNTSTGSGDTDSTSTKPAEEATLKLILTHNAYIYNKDYQITYKDNKRVVLKKGTQIIALDNGKKYLIKGKEFYRIGDNQYVKVSNTISYYYLVHNSFLYNKHGKTIKRNGKRILVRKGVRLEANKVKVVKINGKKFYKVGKSTYIKFRNVKLIISPNN